MRKRIATTILVLAYLAIFWGPSLLEGTGWEWAVLGHIAVGFACACAWAMHELFDKPGTSG